MIKMLRIELDSHYHGSSDVPRPWVARVDGPDPKFGLRREFVRAMNDWANAGVSWRGRTSGVVATFPLRHGPIYEVSRLRGRSSKRYLAREFVRVVDNRVELLDPMSVLAEIDGSAGVDGRELRLRDEPGTRVGEVRGLGAPVALAWVATDGWRRFRLCVGRLYEVSETDRVRLMVVERDEIRTVTQQEALSWLARAS